MSVLHFIAANWLILLAACAALFVLGLVLYIVGKFIQHKGEQIMAEALVSPDVREQAIADAREQVQPLPFNPEPETPAWGEYAPPLYPPAELRTYP